MNNPMCTLLEGEQNRQVKLLHVLNDMSDHDMDVLGATDAGSGGTDHFIVKLSTIDLSF